MLGEKNRVDKHYWLFCTDCIHTVVTSRDVAVVFMSWATVSISTVHSRRLWMEQ